MNPDYAFDGITYQPSFDFVRLTGQLRAVRDLMADGHWRTLAEIARVTGSPESSVSARLRDLRKPRYGSHEIERRRVGGGLFQYRMTN